MDNIGYAVFGRPKGLEAVSNGIFKSLEIDSLLYLSDVDVILSPGERTLLIRRIPTDLSNLEKKDGILIVLYEQAYQHLENRSGGFVGSAICFKDFQPNAEKLIKGLFALFGEIRKHVDTNGKFMRSDADEWHIKLPDAGKNYGFLSDKRMNFNPIEARTKKNTVLVQSLQNYAVSILENAVLNWSFQNVDNIYIANQETVLENLKSKGANVKDYSQFFDFSAQNNYFHSKSQEFISQTNHSKSELNKLDIQAQTTKVTIQNLEQDIIRLKTEKEKEEREKNENLSEINRIKDQHSNWAEKENDHRKTIRDLGSQESELKSKVSKLNREIRKLNDRDDNHATNNLKEQEGGIDIDNKIVFIIVLIGLIGAFIFGYYFGQPDEEVVISDSNPTEQVEKVELKFKSLWDLDPTKQFSEVYQSNLNLLSSNENLSAEELDSIPFHPASFYEKYHSNNNVINFLNNRYLIPVNNDTISSRYFQNNYKEKPEQNQLLLLIQDYKLDPSSIYAMIPEEKKDSIKSDILIGHFKWMIETNNPNVIWYESDSIKIPIIKKKQ